MISATEAQKLYAQPPYTLEQVESQIRQRAVDQNYTCFDVDRLPVEIWKQIEEAGYKISRSAETIEVRWK